MELFSHLTFHSSKPEWQQKVIQEDPNFLPYCPDILKWQKILKANYEKYFKRFDDGHNTTYFLVASVKAIGFVGLIEASLDMGNSISVSLDHFKHNETNEDKIRANCEDVFRLVAFFLKKKYSFSNELILETLGKVKIKWNTSTLSQIPHLQGTSYSFAIAGLYYIGTLRTLVNQQSKQFLVRHTKTGEVLTESQIQLSPTCMMTGTFAFAQIPEAGKDPNRAISTQSVKLLDSKIEAIHNVCKVIPNCFKSLVIPQSCECDIDPSKRALLESLGISVIGVANEEQFFEQIASYRIEMKTDHFTLPVEEPKIRLIQVPSKPVQPILSHATPIQSNAPLQETSLAGRPK